MTDKQFKDAFTAAGGWFFLTQYKLIDSLKDNRKELLDKLFEKGFDSELGGTRTRMASAIKIIKEDRAKEALEKIRDSKMINSKHPEAHDLAEEILATL
jgi:hypothetical protein